jgi:hypothetical protein
MGGEQEGSVTDESARHRSSVRIACYLETAPAIRNGVVDKQRQFRKLRRDGRRFGRHLSDNAIIPNLELRVTRGGVIIGNSSFSVWATCP